MSPPPATGTWRWAAVGGTVALVAYALTLHPGLPGGDAGELASAACAGGVAHPPGYPLHGLLLRLMALVPLGSVLSRFHFLSALCGAATVALVIDVVTRWTKRSAAGVLAGAAWLASPLPWLYATTVEVFALHTALVALVAWALTRDVEAGGSRRSALLLGLASGLALTHHQTSVFVVVPLLAVRAWRHPARPALLGGLALGCAPLLVLPWWSGVDTPFSWGDLRTVDGFLTHVLRREYGTFQLAAGEAGGGLGSFLSAFVDFERSQVFGVIAVVGVLSFGRAWLRAKSRTWLAVGAGAFGLSLVVFGWLANLPLENPLFREVVARFFLMPHLMLCACVALSVPGQTPLTRPAPDLSPLTQGEVMTWVVSGAVVVLGLLQHPRHDPTSVRNYGLALLHQPDDALVLTQGDLIGNSMRALQACEGVSPKLRVIDQQLLSYPWYVTRLRRAMPNVTFPPGDRWHPRDANAFRLQQFLAANGQRPILVCGGFKPGDVTDFRAVPWGLCERLLPPGAPFDEEAWFRESEAQLPPLEGTNARAAKGTWEEAVRRDVWHARAQRGLTALTVGIAHENDPAWLTRAYDVLRDCTEHDEAPQPNVFKNLGIAAGRLGRTAEMKAALRRYVAVAPKDDPELPAVRALAEQ